MQLVETTTSNRKEDSLVPVLALLLVRMLRAVSPRIADYGTKDEWLIEHWFQSDFVDPCHILWLFGVGEWTNGAPDAPRYRFDELDFKASLPEAFTCFYMLPSDDDVINCLDRVPSEHRPEVQLLISNLMKFNDNFGDATPFQLPVPFGEPFEPTHPFHLQVLAAFVAVGYAEILENGAFIWKDPMLPWLTLAKPQASSRS